MTEVGSSTQLGIDFIVNEVCDLTEEMLKSVQRDREISEKDAVLFFGSMMKISRILNFIDNNPELPLTHDQIMNDERLEAAKFVMGDHGRGIFEILKGIDNVTWSRETANVIAEMLKSSDPEQQFQAINILDSIALARSAVNEAESGDSLIAAADLISMCPSNFQELRKNKDAILEMLMIEEDDAAMIIWDTIESFTIH